MNWWLAYRDHRWRDLAPELRARILADSVPNAYDIRPGVVGRRMSRFTHAALCAESVAAYPPPEIIVHHPVRHPVRVVATVPVEPVPPVTSAVPGRWTPEQGLAARSDYQDLP